MALTPFQPYRPNGLSVKTSYLPKAAATDFKGGAPIITSSGLATEAGSDPALNTVMGVAQHNAALSGYGSTDCFMDRIDNGDMFEGSVDKSGTFGTGTTAASQRGTRYGIAKDATSGLWYVDLDDTTNVRVRVEELIDAAAVVQGRVGFTWIQQDNAL